jgi:pyridoxal phosphate enzyme (YggS family)
MDDAVDEQRWNEVRDRIEQVLDSCDRPTEDVKLVAVTKGFPAPLIERAHGAGFRMFGENRVGEALDKKEGLPSEVVESSEWHFIGHLQSNKVRKIPGEFDLIHSVDRMSLVKEIDKRMGRESLTQNVLMQVNVSGESSKHGVEPDRADELAREIMDRDPIHLRGLMTMAPWTDDEDVLRETFRRCRDCRDRLEDQLDTALPVLSMGMTNDYEIAIEEGSTMLRLGRALFGERPD